MNSCLAAAVLLAFGFSASGCCTIVRGRTQIVEITSSPPGATATVQPAGATLTTPGSIVLPRKSSYVVHLEKPGYSPAEVTLRSSASSALLRNIVWVHPIGWLVGILVDVGNGSGYDLEPAAVTATLSPTS